jgi:hypothetical protein
MENLRALVNGHNLNAYQRALAKQEFEKIGALLDVLDSEFSFDDLEVWGSNSGATGILINVPEAGRESVCLKHIPTGKIGHVELNT